MYLQKHDWAIVYDKAVREDGSFFFPKRLTPEFLQEQRKVLGSYIYFNQYLNEIIPDGEQDFKKEWLKYYQVLPENRLTFAFIDPASSLKQTADYTALTIVHVSEENDWYLEVAKRAKMTATQIVELFFTVHRLFNPLVIGVEVVAFQMALMHIADSEMRKRNIMLPLKGISRGPDKTKEMRIRGLIPRFEWNRISVKQGLTDFEDEYFKFPKSPHDDILDSLSSIEEIASAPAKPKEPERVPTPNSPEYESWYIRQLTEKAARQAQEGNGYE